jgi:hypothetical protein
MNGWWVGGLALLLTSITGEARSAVGPTIPTQITQGEKKEAEVKEVLAGVIVLHGTNDGKGIDPDIGDLPALKKPPFSAYNSYKLLEKYDLKLPKGEAKEKKLPDGGKLSLLFKDVNRGKKKEDPTKFVLSATIEKADGKQFLPGLDVNALKGEYFFIAGQKYNGGILVIGVKIH